jgi:hypothetical protein
LWGRPPDRSYTYLTSPATGPKCIRRDLSGDAGDENGARPRLASTRARLLERRKIGSETSAGRRSMPDDTVDAIVGGGDGEARVGSVKRELRYQAMSQLELV